MSEDLEHAGTIEWSIENFKKEEIKHFSTEENVESPMFSILVRNQVIKWTIQLYPNGLHEVRWYPPTQDHICVCLKIKNFEQLFDKLDLQVLFSIGIRQYARQDFMLFENKLLLENTSGVHKGSMPHKQLFDPFNSFILGGELTCFVEIKIVNSIENLKDTQAPVMMRTCLSDIKNFLNDELYADFKLKTNDGETLTAHKSILAARSPVFYAMLKPQTKEAEENQVDIPDFDSKIMKEVLRFIYGCEVENLDDIAADLVHAAEKYELTELKKMCIESLVSKMSAENVVSSLIIADLLSGTNELFEKSIRIIIRNYRTIRQSNEWQSLCKNLKMKVLEQMAEKSMARVLILVKTSSTIPHLPRNDLVNLSGDFSFSLN